MTQPSRPHRAGMIDHSTGRLSRAVSLVRDLGFGEVLRRAVGVGPAGVYAFVKRNIRHEVANRVSRSFDRRFNVDTAGSVQLGTLDVVGPNRDLGNEAVSTSPKSLNWLLEQAPIPANATFVDIGCGKGRTVLLAAHRFRRSIGVEFARELVEIAQANTESYRQTAGELGRMQVVHADATQYVFPEEPLVVYLYNPFSESVLRGVLANLTESLRRNPRPCTFIYATGMGTLGMATKALAGTGYFQEVSRGQSPGFWDAIRRLDYAIHQFR